MEKLPVYRIDDFVFNSGQVYANHLSPHLQNHHFIHHAHKHDFYACVIFTKGTGTHEIDFKSYKIEPGSIFFLHPGQMHKWEFSESPDGYIFFHSREFFELVFSNHQLRSYPFFGSIYARPAMSMADQELIVVDDLFNMLITELAQDLPFKLRKCACLIDLIYTELARKYPQEAATDHSKGLYSTRMQQLGELIDLHFREKKAPSEYAGMLHTSTRHLNRMARETVNKSVTELIADRVVLEIKRLLAQESYSIGEVADKTGFEDHSYFHRFFRKHTGQTPGEFRRLHT